jgi:putative hydrolase of the HAD superfamily
VHQLWETRLGLPDGEILERMRDIWRGGSVGTITLDSHEAGFSKPDPRIYALICTRLNVPPREMIFLDDAGVCVAGARDAGIHAIRYQDNAQAIAAIEELLTSL